MNVADQQLHPKFIRYETLDHWRGFAALAIVVYHSTVIHGVAQSASAPDLAAYLLWITTRLWIGVPIFFVISGYCICASADACRNRGQSTLAFFTRRFRRIYPPYWTALAICAAGGWISCGIGFDAFGGNIPNPLELSWDQWLGNLTRTESWRPRVFGRHVLYELPVAWTLCFEEQFYVVIGVLLCFCRRRLFAGIAVITLLVFLNSVPLSIAPLRALGWNPNLWQLRWNSTFLRWMWLDFAVGCGVYFHSNYADWPRKRLIEFVFLAGILLIVRSGEDFLKVDATHLTTQFVAISFGLILLMLHPWDHQIGSLSVLQPMKFCGTICYSLYLIHDMAVLPISTIAWSLGIRSPLLTLCITVPLCTASALLIGWCFYMLVERRWTNLSLDCTALAKSDLSAQNATPGSSPFRGAAGPVHP